MPGTWSRNTHQQGDMPFGQADILTIGSHINACRQHDWQAPQPAQSAMSATTAPKAVTSASTSTKAL
jgi:hypothetical protein